MWKQEHWWQSYKPLPFCISDKMFGRSESCGQHAPKKCRRLYNRLQILFDNVLFKTLYSKAMTMSAFDFYSHIIFEVGDGNNADIDGLFQSWCDKCEWMPWLTVSFYKSFVVCTLCHYCICMASTVAQNHARWGSRGSFNSLFSVCNVTEQAQALIQHSSAPRTAWRNQKNA